MNNPMAQEFLDEEDYFSDNSGERLYVNLMQSRGYTK